MDITPSEVGTFKLTAISSAGTTWHGGGTQALFSLV
jgi:hypothetical protein